MAASRQDINEWFDSGVKSGATHMLVVCDDFNFEDYPVYVLPGQSARLAHARYSYNEMQRVMEVYALFLDKESQLNEPRALHFESVPPIIIEEEF